MTPSDSYVQPFKLNPTNYWSCFGKELSCPSDDFTKVILLLGCYLGKISYLPSNQVNKVPSTDVPLELYLSTLGMTGQTAYHGLLDIGQP